MQILWRWRRIIRRIPSGTHFAHHSLRAAAQSLLAQRGDTALCSTPFLFRYQPCTAGKGGAQLAEDVETTGDLNGKRQGDCEGAETGFGQKRLLGSVQPAAWRGRCGAIPNDEPLQRPARRVSAPDRENSPEAKLSRRPPSPICCRFPAQRPRHRSGHWSTSTS